MTEVPDRPESDDGDDDVVAELKRVGDEDVPLSTRTLRDRPTDERST